MTHPHAIHRSQSRTRSQAGRPALERYAPSVDHDKFQRASPPSRNLGRGFGSSHFLITYGVGSRVAARPLADQSLAPGTFQSITERGPVHSLVPFKRPVPKPHQATGKDFARGTKPFVGAAKSYD